MSVALHHISPIMEASSATACDDLVVGYFCRQIFTALGQPHKETAILKRKWRIAPTAAWYFRQFYLRNSLLDHDPRLLMLCCIFLAGKTEDHFVNISELLKIYAKIPEARILACEILLLEGIEFNLKVFHPQNCVYSIIADVKRHEQIGGDHITKEENAGADRKKLLSELIGRWLATCEEYLIIVQCSTLVLQLSALCIAVCVMKIAVPEELENMLSFDTYLSQKFDETFLNNEVGLYLDVVRECIDREVSAEGQQENAVLLQACMKELKARNRWTK